MVFLRNIKASDISLFYTFLLKKKNTEDFFPLGGVWRTLTPSLVFPPGTSRRALPSWL